MKFNSIWFAAYNMLHIIWSIWYGPYDTLTLDPKIFKSMFFTFESMLNQSWPAGNWSVCCFNHAHHKCLSRERFNSQLFIHPFNFYSEPRLRISNMAHGIGWCCVTCWDIYTVVGSLRSMALDWAKFLMVLNRTLYLNQYQNLWSNGRTLWFWDQWSSFWHPVPTRTLIVYRDATLLTIYRQQRWFQKMTHLNDNSKMCFHVVTNLDQSRLQLRQSQSKYSRT